MRNKKNQSATYLACSGTISLIVWIWNIVDVDRSIPAVFDIPETSNVNIGINSRGNLEATLAF